MRRRGCTDQSTSMAADAPTQARPLFVDAGDRRQPAVAPVEQPAAVPDDLHGVNGPDAPGLFGHVKVRSCLLLLRRDLHQHHVVGIVAPHEHIAHQRDIRLRIETAEEDVPRPVGTKRLVPCFG